MKWDAKKRRYVENARVLTKAEVRKRIDDYVTHQQKEVERKAEKLLIGAVTVGVFFEYLRHKITAWHSLTGSTAYGGPENTTNEQWARINQKILSELAFVNQFEVEAQTSFDTAQALAAELVQSIRIPAGLETLVEERVSEALLRASPSTASTVIRQTVIDSLADSIGAEEASTLVKGLEVTATAALIGATIPSRAQMYADAAYSTYENSVANRERDAGAVGVRRVCENDNDSCDDCVEWAKDEYLPFEDVPDIGTLACLNNDRCFFEFSYEGVEPLAIDRGLTG